MIWKTRINQMTGTMYPIVMGAFAGIGKAEFVAAFSNAGGLGILPALNFKLESFQKELQKIKSLTDKPYGVNISIRPPNISENKDQFSKEYYLKYVEIAINEGIKIFSTSAYQAAFIGERIKEAGCLWFHKCALIKHALSAEKLGVDAITLVGLEGAGAKNPNQHTTMVNITLGRKLLKVPIIAAGGIGDARGFLAALAMGAEAVCFGTALLITEESPVSEDMKIKWLNSNIFEEEFHKKIYNFESRDIRTISTAIGHRVKIIPIKAFIEEIINDAEHILKSWGFNINKFNLQSN
jgi:NAD(P)H-dependent flavin oxidoreductase YrpB (nitropropane dioxygenase family)